MIEANTSCSNGGNLTTSPRLIKCRNVYQTPEEATEHVVNTEDSGHRAPWRLDVRMVSQNYPTYISLASSIRPPHPEGTTETVGILIKTIRAARYRICHVIRSRYDEISNGHLVHGYLNDDNESAIRHTVLRITVKMVARMDSNKKKITLQCTLLSLYVINFLVFFSALFSTTYSGLRSSEKNTPKEPLMVVKKDITFSGVNLAAVIYDSVDVKLTQILFKYEQ